MAGGLARRPHIPRRVPGWLTAYAGLHVTAVILLLLAAPTRTFVLAPQAITARAGHSYTAALSSSIPYVIRSDEMEDGTRSRLRLYENGVPLGPAHTGHTSIRDAGRGAYSHWSGSLVFSSSDNTDPRTNGRVYTASVPLSLPTPLLLSLLPFGTLVLFGLMCRLRQAALRAVPGLLSLGVVLVPALLAGAWAARPMLTAELVRSEIQPAGGSAYSVPVELQPTFPASLLYVDLPDSSSQPLGSALTLREDGTPLGPAHTTHDQIRTRGSGSFSHWDGSLIFSSSDSTDPRTNGHRYSVQVRAQLRPALISWGFALFVACAAALRRLGQRRPSKTAAGWQFHALMLYATLLLALVAVADIYSISEFYPLFSRDSLSFLVGNSARGFAYAAVLKASILLAPSGRLLVPLQWSAMFLSFVALGWSVGRLTRSGLLGWLTVLLLAADTGLTRLALMIASEPSFVALVAFHFAAVLTLLRRPSASAALLAGSSAGLAILVRPAAYSLLLTLPLVIAFADSGRLRRALQTALPAGALLALGAATNFAASGSLGTQSIGGLSLFGHVLHLAKPEATSPHPELYRQVVEATAPAVTSAHASYPEEYWQSTSSDYNKLLWGLAVPRMIAYVEDQARLRGEQEQLGSGNTLENNMLIGRINRLSMDLAIGIIRNDPIGYARHAAAHLYGMWLNLFKDYEPIRAMALARAADGLEAAKWLRAKEYFSRGGGYPADLISARLAENPDPVMLADAIWSAVRPALRGLGLVGAILTLAAAAAFAGRIIGRSFSPVLTGLAVCSLHIWAYFGLVAAVQAALDRYSVVFEPVLVAGFALGCASLAAGLTALMSRLGASRMASAGPMSHVEAVP